MPEILLLLLVLLPLLLVLLPGATRPILSDADSDVPLKPTLKTSRVRGWIPRRCTEQGRKSIGLTLPALRWAQGPRWRSHASLHEYLVHVAPIGSANAQSCTAKAREASGLEGRPLTARTAQRVLGESLAPAQEPTNNTLPTKISQQHARRHHHPMPILHATATRNETGAWPQDVVRLGI